MRPHLLALALTLALQGIGAACAATAAPPPGSAVARNLVERLAPAGTHAVVLFFIASDCPISNRYVPEMHRLEQQFGDRGVAFWYVYPNLTETAATIAAHKAAFTQASHTLADLHQQLTTLTGARVTPEAAILLPRDGTLHPLYVGRIDDRYRSIGQERPQATRHDLEEAIVAALSGKPIAAPGGPPIGCGIVSTR